MTLKKNSTLAIIILVIHGCTGTVEKASKSSPFSKDTAPLKDYEIVLKDKEVTKTPFVLKIDTTFEIEKDSTPYIGEILYKGSWKDQSGFNLFVLSKTYNYKNGYGKAELYGYHYTLKNNNWTLNWKTYDFVEGEGCDLSINIPLTNIKITDLDSNKAAEVGYLYELDNRCDAVVVPCKLVMHIDKKKYAIRGFSQLHLGPAEVIMNEMLKEEGKSTVSYKNIDDSWKHLPDTIQNYYFSLWDRYVHSYSY